MSDGDNENRGDGETGGPPPAGQGVSAQGGGRGPLTLKPRGGGQIAAGTVKQSFSHGRSKTVVVETKRRRPEGVAPERPRPQAAATAPRPAAPSPAPSQGAPRPAAGSGSNLNLSQSELAARQRAVDAAREVEDRRTADAARQQADEAGARRREVDARAAAEAAARAAQAPAPAPPTPAPAAPPLSAPSASPALAPALAAAPTLAAAPAPAQVVHPEARPATPVASAPPAPEPPAAPKAWERLGQTRRAEGGETARPAARTEGTLSPRPRGPDAAGDRPRAEAGYGDRAAPRPQAGGYGDRGARPQAAAGGGYGDRSPRPQGAPGGGYGARTGAPGGAGGGYGDRGPRPQGGPGGGGYGARTGAPGGGGYGDRGPRPQSGPGGGYGARPSGPGGGYGDRGPRPPREGGAPAGDGTVRYSALAPRPSGPRTGPGGPPRMGGGMRPSAAPSAPEFTKTARTSPPHAGARRPGGASDEDDRRRGAAPGKALSRTKGAPTRREGRLTIQAVAGDGDAAERMRSLASVRRAREREREKRRGVGGPEQGARVREVVIPDVITLTDLAQRMAIRAGDVIKYLMRQGTMLTLNDVLDADTAELIAGEFGHTVKRVSESDVETGFLAEDDHADDTSTRPPVVTVMGHVDHGKTSLLDALRSADVAAGEHGGITQHIGAYQVKLENGEAVTFLDTPGHAAFSAMRARGANVTDIVVLVVAADDGVMPQTIEAINHAKAAEAPIIVAVNKIDKPDANPTRVINELLQHEIVAESLGGETQVIEVSATQKLGLEDLIEAISLQAEVMDLRANADRSAEGTVIESKLDKGRGPVASVLIQRGTLKRGQIIVAGQAWGRVRALVNDRGEQVAEAGPSEPVEILGLDQAPSPGEPFAIVEDEARARELTEYRIRQRREKQIGGGASASLAEMMAKLQNKQVKELALVIKGDVQGSTEAIIGSLEKLGNEEVRARIIHSGVGGITESDVQLAKGSGAPIIGFNVRASKQARDLAEREGVEIRYYAIIYDLIDDIKGVLSGMLSPIQRETWLGNALVLEVFNITKVGNVAGCRVTEGVIRRGAKVRVLREDVVVLEMGTLQTLRRFKDDVAEVTNGYECGMNYANQDIKPGDTIECFTVETVARSL